MASLLVRERQLDLTITKIANEELATKAADIFQTGHRRESITLHLLNSGMIATVELPNSKWRLLDVSRDLLKILDGREGECRFSNRLERDHLMWSVANVR